MGNNLVENRVGSTHQLGSKQSLSHKYLHLYTWKNLKTFDR